MAASASASSSQVPCGKYDVFISFRGADVRFGFLTYLEKELRGKNIDVYMDCNMERGEEITSSLLNAIEGSMIALVIFSKHYASSPWCLKELVKIMDCKEAGKQIVIPLFYLVDPSDVRHQKRTYAEAFTLHEEEFKDSVDNLRIWRSVLEKSANLSGHRLSEFQNESKLIDEIVEDVLNKLEENTPSMPNSEHIGFHRNFPCVESLMEIELQEVRTLGIWGMGGIGKTTLVQAIFDKFLSKFESGCFLENVRENATKVGDLKSLHQKLISKLLNEKDHIDMKVARRRLKGKKVLIVLDDVNDSEQLEVLDGERLLWGSGSRIIVTSRDKHILRSGDILDKYIHEVKALNFEESLELFCRHAFNRRHPKMGYEELARTTVANAEGIPLALKVLGSHFHSRDPAYWESELRKLERYPNEKIQKILKISYDGLDHMDKEIFLDIAFFFVGDDKDTATYGLEACDFTAVSGIQNLIDKALIKLDQYDCIVMHDLIREMAEQIVRGENKRPPETRSRLNDADEIYNVLKSNMGTDTIEGIILDLDQIKYVQVEADTFGKMKNLRFLKFFSSTSSWTSPYKPSIILPSDLHAFSNKLRYLHWDHYPLKTLPSGSYLENLVHLHMQNSNVKMLWDGKQDLGNLKTINLSESEQLMELPDLSMAHKLESVNLESCKSLRSVHPSILSLPRIIEMDVFDCSKLESIESETPLESLYVLRADFCHLKKLRLPSNKFSRLRLVGTAVEILHFPIGGFPELTEIRLKCRMVGSVSIDELCHLTNIEVFEVTNLKQVIGTKQLRSLFYAWRNLRVLCLLWSTHLSKIPDNIKALTRLESLSLCDSTMETLPACVNHLSSLKYIRLGSCERLKSILGLPPFLQLLDASECPLLETVSSDSPVQNRCFFNFRNCEKLDERSLRYIHEFILFPVTSASDCYCDITCYPGSKVPEWMECKPMTDAFNATEFTCNLERSQDLLICFIAPPHHFSQQLRRVIWNFSHDEFHSSKKMYWPTLNQDHVLLWSVRRSSYDAWIGIDAKISCEFFLEYFDGEKHDYRRFPAKAHIIYYSEPGRNRKRVADILVEDQLPPTKQLKNSQESHDTMTSSVTPRN